MKNFHIIIRPVDTEKSTKGNALAKYTFFVKREATKIDVKNTVQELYGVEVKSIQIIPTPQKYRFGRQGHPLGKRELLKKAIVTLKDAKKTIDLNKFLKEK